VEKFILENRGEIVRETEIISVDPGRNQATNSRGDVYQYRRLIWAADLKTLYRLIDLESVTNKKVIKGIETRRKSLSGKIGGDSVFTLYLTVNLERSHFAEISSAHFFYTPSLSGLSHVRLEELHHDVNTPHRFTDDKSMVAAWLKRFLELNTYEISIPALRDSSLAPEGKTGLIISVLFDYSLTKHIQAMGWYDEFKKLITDNIIEVLEESIFPGLKAGIIDNFTATPLTIERISGNSEGAITGWAFTNDFMPAVNKLPKVASSVLTPIPNIYQAGQWTYSPSGLPISILTGKLAADKVLKDLA
jgi:phytoene dehydrogenase-like protein